VPTIVTRGVASARGAGTFSAAPPPPPPTPTPPPPGPPPVFQTVTFNSSGVWTAPAGVSTILNLQVAGGLYSFSEGFFQGGQVFAAVYNRRDDDAGSIGAFTFAQVGAYADSVLAQFNTSSPASLLPDRTVSFSTLDLHFNPVTSQYYYEYQPQTYRVQGEAFISGGAWYNRSNEIVGGPNIPPQDWALSIAIYTEGGAFPGSPSSAFGRTAAGTTSAGQPQNITSASSVSVTPGQQYNIEVGSSSGYVTFQFSQS
jgi:hypothetical protein